MNFLARSIGNVARACLGNSIQGGKLSLPRLFVNPNIEGSLVNTTRSCLGNILQEYADIIFTYNIFATGMAESAVAKHQQEYPDQTVLYHSIFETIFRMLRETGFEQVRMGSTLLRMHLGKYNRRKVKRKNPLDGRPFAKGVVIKTMIKKPKKPNSANRKCVVVKLTTGKEMIAYVPGIGHNLQEHSVVLCRVGRVRDTPGVKIRCVRGKYDLPHPIKKAT